MILEPKYTIERYEHGWLVRGTLELSEKDGKTYLNLGAASSRETHAQPTQDWDPTAPF